MAAHSSILAWILAMDRGAWWATVYGVAKSWTRLINTHTKTYIYIYIHTHTHLYFIVIVTSCYNTRKGFLDYHLTPH